MEGSTPRKIYIEEMAEKLGRAVHTIRQWIREGDLPKKLEPKREGGRQKIYWTEGQIQGLRNYADKRSARRGWQGARS
jgi:predicted site-specific integrase-resolvase